ncbi:MAG: response regulator [Lachnospiraceae bacterium]|nr:response regulator [Lachnospiraceae bacterium]
MNLIIPEIIFAFFVLALYFAYSTFHHKDLKFSENRLFFVLCISSAIWSFGFFGVFIQTIPDNAYIWRGIGMAGTFAYLISAQFLVCHLFKVSKKIRYFCEGFSFLGIPLYFFVIQKEQTTYKPSAIGMTYSFNPGIWNTLYTAYSVIIAINLFWVVIYSICHAKSQRIKDLGKKVLGTEIVIMFGMVLDTIFPLIGLAAIPGSTISQFLGLCVMYKTITFVRRAKINIENMSEFIYYSLKVPVLVYDANQNLKLMNDVAFDFFNIDKNEQTKPNIDDLFVLKSSNVFDFAESSHDVDAICISNNLYCTLSINRIFYDKYDDSIGYIIIVTDLSEKMRAMKELEQAMKEAEYANKAKSTFLANMSHEIRTPLNAITGFSELILRMDIDEQVRRHVEDIKWSSHNLLAIINDILDISKIESGKIELVLGDYYAANLFNDLKVIIAPQAEKKGLTFNFEFDDEIPKVLNGDKTRIRGVLINILNNAVKYTHKGSITFSARIISRTDTKIKLSYEVTDTGSGIKKENLDKLFESFERIDKRVNYGIEGSGLGLSIANGYISLMGGEIKVDSTYKKGSTFTVIIEQDIVDATPIKHDYFANNPDTSYDLYQMYIKDTKVLVVDDNIINLRVADGILSSYGLNVDTATCGSEAINLCKKNTYSILFLDQMMPEMDGIETMTEIRKLDNYKDNSTYKIVVLTADAIKGARDNLIKSGFDEYLGKPINIKQLERVLINYIPEEKITYVDKVGSNNNQGKTKHDSITKNELNTLKDMLPQLSIEEAINRCGGTVADFLKILQVTHSFGMKQISELEETWMKLDYQTYIIKIHSLKSTTKNIGATSLAKLAARQEEQGRSGNQQFIDDNFIKFKMEYLELLEHIKKVLIHYDMLSEQKVKNTLPIIDEDQVIPVLKNIERCIEDFEFAKVFDILDQIKGYQLPDKYASLLQQIEELMQDLNVDEIKELLEQII